MLQSLLFIHIDIAPEVCNQRVKHLLRRANKATDEDIGSGRQFVLCYPCVDSVSSELGKAIVHLHVVQFDHARSDVLGPLQDELGLVWEQVKILYAVFVAY